MIKKYEWHKYHLVQITVTFWIRVIRFTVGCGFCSDDDDGDGSSDVGSDGIGVDVGVVVCVDVDDDGDNSVDDDDGGVDGEGRRVAAAAIWDRMWSKTALAIAAIFLASCCKKEGQTDS